MDTPLLNIMIIDDNQADNLYHTIILKKSRYTGEIHTFQYAEKALAYLQTAESQMDLILLDINMPRMNGFEFLEAYDQLDEVKKAHAVIIMLTTSLNPRDRERADQYPDVKEYLNKPLSREEFLEIVSGFFPKKR